MPAEGVVSPPEGGGGRKCQRGQPGTVLRLVVRGGWAAPLPASPYSPLRGEKRESPGFAVLPPPGGETCLLPASPYSPLRGEKRESPGLAVLLPPGGETP